MDAAIAEAAERFGVPARWIRAVILAESAGNPHAVSRAGAMGLMQIMPGTWRELRDRHGLGDNPFDPRDNILAGAAYLRAMHDRFGSPDFLAAYNAGPERYAEHLAGRPLPRETRRYMASLAPLIGGAAAGPMQADRSLPTSDWRAAPLFVTRSERDRGSLSDADDAATDDPAGGSRGATPLQSPSASDGLFVHSGREESE
jgi:membrane-bound lytic murein transglycosylase B